MATKPQTPEALAALAKTWTTEKPKRSYASYSLFSEAIRILAAAGWNSRAIVAKFIAEKLHPAEKSKPLYDHVTRLRRNEGI